MSQQSKKEFAKFRINELIDAVVERESIPKQGESYADLGWIKFYVKELVEQKCDECAEDIRPPSGPKRDK